MSVPAVSLTPRQLARGLCFNYDSDDPSRLKIECNFCDEVFHEGPFDVSPGISWLQDAAEHGAVRHLAALQEV